MKFRRFALVIIAAVAVTNFIPLSTQNKLASIDKLIVADSEIEAKNYEELVRELNLHFDEALNKELELKIDNQRLSTNLKNLGVSFDTYKSIENILNKEKQTVLSKLTASISEAFKPTEIKPIAQINKQVLNDSLKKHIPNLGPSIDAKIKVASNYQVAVKAHQDGLIIDEEKLISDLSEMAEDLSPSNISVESTEDEASYTEIEAKVDAEILSSLLAKELRLIYSTEFQTIEVKTYIQKDWINIKNESIETDLDSITQFLSKNVSPQIDVPKQDAVIKSVPSEKNKKAEIEGIAKNGRELITELAADKIASAIKESRDIVILPVSVTQGQIIDQTANPIKWQLLSTGMSDFTGSIPNRAFNVRKGLNEVFTNIYIPADEIFSYNSYLGSVDTSKGWKMAYAIFGGTELRAVPGGGLCQCSTTIFRAALYSGLEILEQRNHSMYVHYYKELGDGLDSTIYPGIVNLRFKNDTKNPILIQSYTDGDFAIVNFYGVDDGRKIEMFGPYYGRSSEEQPPAEFSEILGELRRTQIGWVQRITYADGTVSENKVVSTYNSVPK